MLDDVGARVAEPGEAIGELVGRDGAAAREDERPGLAERRDDSLHGRERRAHEGERAGRGPGPRGRLGPAGGDLGRRADPLVRE